MEQTIQLHVRQKAILAFIRQCIERTGMPPTVREIGAHLGVKSPSVVNHHLERLELLGYLRRNPHKARGLSLVSMKDSFKNINIPIYGMIAAGKPIPLPDPNAAALEWVTVTEHLLPRQHQGLFALRVQGDSMVDALINNGDIVVLRHQQSADPGEMVAAWLADREETTLKLFYPEGAQIRLQPANSAMKPIYADAANVRISGVVVMVIRCFSR